MRANIYITHKSHNLRGLHFRFRQEYTPQTTNLHLLHRPTQTNTFLTDLHILTPTYRLTPTSQTITYSQTNTSTSQTNTYSQFNTYLTDQHIPHRRYPGLSWTILDYPGLFWIILDYLGKSWALLDISWTLR